MLQGGGYQPKNPMMDAAHERKTRQPSGLASVGANIIGIGSPDPMRGGS